MKKASHTFEWAFLLFYCVIHHIKREGVGLPQGICFQPVFFFRYPPVIFSHKSSYSWFLTLQNPGVLETGGGGEEEIYSAEDTFWEEAEHDVPLVDM
jgi:hypothetical protein